ncbi:putative iron-regulated transporter [Bombardia bombarda]|uniref:Solute carrier family 40 member n=1 Tax=Bombardia bombarda TaxID=252184 RepID=A0AA39X103_9PEZI|nr:putative iron-regulated transporter [Bombardia bombarda]
MSATDPEEASDAQTARTRSAPDLVQTQPPATSPMAPERDHPDNDGLNPSPGDVSQELALRLYTSHFLSTWNSRLFEFASVLFLAAIFPDTLLPMSLYALGRSGAAILFAQPIGSWIDHGDRLNVVRTSIVGQRVAVALSCGLFWLMELGRSDMGALATESLFALTVALTCVEKLCSVMNLVAVERDWVVVITEGNDSARRDLNARMRRIDLICKLLGPLAISTIAIASTLIAIQVTLAMNLAAVFLEYCSIAQVYKMVPKLQRDTHHHHQEDSHETITTPEPPTPSARLKQTASRILPTTSLAFYFNHPAFLPSLSLSLLYLTVLSFSGQMITYLMSVGYSPLHVGIARTASTVCELSATWFAPRLMRRIGVVRGGIWSLCWQMAWLAVGLGWFLSADLHDVGAGMNSSMIRATGLAVGVALSRVGLWGYDLCAQDIVQEEVETENRGTFSAIETSFQNLFETMSYATTIIFSRPDQFQWPVGVSIMAVYISGGLYAMFVRKRRGHLFHRPRSACLCTEKQRGEQV